MNEFFETPNAKQPKSSVARGRDRTDVSIRAITVRHCAPLARAAAEAKARRRTILSPVPDCSFGLSTHLATVLLG